MKTYAATKLCIGWGQKFRGVQVTACPAAAQVPNVSRYKRCPACAADQHRLVVNAAHRRNWKKYHKRKLRREEATGAPARPSTKPEPKPVDVKGKPRLAKLLRDAKKIMASS